MTKHAQGIHIDVALLACGGALLTGLGIGFMLGFALGLLA